MYTCVYIYIYIHIHTYVYVCVYIYIYIYTPLCQFIQLYVQHVKACFQDFRVGGLEDRGRDMWPEGPEGRYIPQVIFIHIHQLVIILYILLLSRHCKHLLVVVYKFLSRIYTCDTLHMWPERTSYVTCPGHVYTVPWPGHVTCIYSVYSSVYIETTNNSK